MPRFILPLLLSLLCARGAETVAPGKLWEWGGVTMPGRTAALAVLTNTTLVSLNSDWVLAQRSDGTLLAYGSNTKGQTNVPAGQYAHSDAGWYHGIACTPGGDVVEWGSPYAPGGTVLPNTLLDEWIAVRPPLSGIVMVAAGDDHSAALRDDGTVFAWGGRHSVTNWSGLITNVVAIDCTWYALLALKADGTVVAVGENSNAGGYITPPAGLSNIVQIGCSQFSMYAVRNDGTVYCWGMPDVDGFLTPPAAATNVTHVGGGRYHSIVRRGDGSLFAWGSNANGQLNTPSGLTNANFVTAERYNNAAIQPTGGSAGGGGGEASAVHVAKTGSDSNPGTQALPFLTVQKGMNSALVPGSVIYVHAGDYPEYVATAASGTQASPITLTTAGDGEVTIRGFRFNNHAWNVLDGVTITKSQNSWGQAIRVERLAHNSKVQFVTVRDIPNLQRTNFVFNATSNSIYSPSGSDWAAAGFEVGGRIRTGASTLYPYDFANANRNWSIKGITNDALYLNEAMVTETNPSVWSVVYASPVSHDGVKGLETILGSGTCATNLVVQYSTFTNIWGMGIAVGWQGPHTIRGNRFSTVAWAGMRLGSDNILVENNLFIDSTKWLFYSPTEQVEHPMGEGAYDFVQGYLRGDTSMGSQVVIRRNWFQNAHNPLGQGAGSLYATNWLFQSNVFVGFPKQYDGMGRLNNLTIANNTFYRIGFDEGGNGSAVNESTGSSSTFATNHVNMRNLYLDIGPHAATNAEGFYSKDYTAGANTYFGSNYVAGPEPTGWQGKANFVEVDGINGGNPLLVNIADPLGPDGLPFTADDGLRPLPHSPLALAGIGALEPVAIEPGKPKSHFTLTPAVPGWFDLVGVAFDPSWSALAPFGRTNYVRPWFTPDAMGSVPCTVQIDARGSISGSYSTNHWHGITNYTVNWGDGAIDSSWRPTNTHTYLWPGTFEVSLVTRNSNGHSDTNTRSIRILPQDQYSGTVYHVATNGSDSAAGTLAAPFLTINKAASMVVAGDFIAVHPGTYPEYTRLNRNVATHTSRVSVHGFGATAGSFQVDYPNWTIHGFDLNGQPMASGAIIYVQPSADNTRIINCVLRDASPTASAINVNKGPTFLPLDGATNGLVASCTFTNIKERAIGILTGHGWTISGCFATDNRGEADFIRPFGQAHVIQDCWVYSLSPRGEGGHTDFIQYHNLQDTNTPPNRTTDYWFRDILVQRCLIEGDPNTTYIDHQIGQMEPWWYADERSSNMVWRANVFKFTRDKFNDSTDGVKFIGNTFVFTPRIAAHMTAGGGDKGSSYGTLFHNNAFFGSGLADEGDDTGWYYNARTGDQATNTTVTGDWNYVASQSGAVKDETMWKYNGQEAHGINGGMPGFIALEAGDYRLATNSPLYLAGTNLTAMDLLGDDVDFLGNPLPTTGAWSIGAFQSAVGTSGAVIPPPDPDTTAPTPNPMTWASAPAATTNSIVTMTATTATDALTPPVQYFFDELTGNPGGSDSGWVSDPVYTDTGLTGATQYTYRVAARDALGNQTAWSTSLSATTQAEPQGEVGGGTLNATTVNAGSIQ